MGKSNGTGRRLYADSIVFVIGILTLLLFVIVEIKTHLMHAYRINALSRMIQALAACSVLYCGAYLHKRRTQSNTAVHLVFSIFFVLYLYLVLSFTLIDETMGRGAESIYQLLSQGARTHYVSYFVNLIPFRSIYNVYIVGFIKGYVHIHYTALNLLGNILVFMPLAFFLPLFFKKQRKWHVFLITAIISVVAIELMQFLLMVGSCDVDDLILNAGGAMIMFGILEIPKIKRIAQKFSLHAWE